MTSLAFVLGSALVLLPTERHIDCATWAGGNTEIGIRIVARDGSKVSFRMELLPGSTPTTARDIIQFRLENAGWRVEAVGKEILVVRGSKNAPVRSVEFTSKDWKPDVRAALIVPKEK